MRVDYIFACIFLGSGADVHPEIRQCCDPAMHPSTEQLTAHLKFQQPYHLMVYFDLGGTALVRAEFGITKVQ